MLVVAWVVVAATAVTWGIDGGDSLGGDGYGGGRAEGGRRLLAVNGEEIKERAKELYASWAQIYGLDNASSLLPPPSPLPFPPAVPPAPHLEDCSARTAWRRASEARGPGGEPPLWARGQGEGGRSGEPVRGGAVGGAEGGGEGCGEGPLPPWVRGADVDNLPLTRVAQRDIWESQRIGASCEGRRLLLARWWPAERHDLGSQVHLAGAYLSIAMAHNRTFVPWPGQFDRALLPACQDLGQRGSWECYFFPVASSDCTQRAQQALAAGAVPPCASQGLTAAAASDAPIVCVELQELGELFMEQGSEAGRLWGSVYLTTPPTVVHWGQMQGMSTNESMTHWWRAQATRFMLRWPSAHLCHVTNQQRHAAFGMLVANQLAEFIPTQTAFLRGLSASNAITESQYMLLSSMDDYSSFLPPPTFPIPFSDASSFSSSSSSSSASAPSPSVSPTAQPPLPTPETAPEVPAAAAAEVPQGESSPPHVRSLHACVWPQRGFPAPPCSAASCAPAADCNTGESSSSREESREVGAEEAYRMVGGGCTCQGAWCALVQVGCGAGGLWCRWVVVQVGSGSGGFWP
ncbi:unnamed protein product, partial [Closterium sp. Naga37s-1]